MCGFWNGGLAVVMGSRAVGLTGGFAKFNLSALRLPVKEKNVNFRLLRVMNTFL